MQAFVRLVKDAVMRQLDEFQVCADRKIFTIGKGQENLVAYRLPFRIGSFTRLHHLHVSSCQNNPPFYWVGTPGTLRGYGRCAIDRGKRLPPEIWRWETLYLFPLIHVCRASNIKVYYAGVTRICLVRFGRACY